MRAILFAGGNLPSRGKIEEYVNDKDFIICADSGYDHAKKVGVNPDIIIGDMDSVKSTDIDINKIVYPKRKDYTDSELIMEYALEKGYDELIMFGFIGTRMDHTITNISLLLKYSELDAVIVDENNEIRAAGKTNIIKGKRGDIISIIPIGGDLVGISTKNLEYPLENETLYFGEGRGVSNVMEKEICEIEIKSGRGLLIKSKD